MRGLTIAVTGGAGFVGSHVCHLLGIGAHEKSLNFKCAEVRIIDLKPPRNDNKLLAVFEDNAKPVCKLSFLQGSILDIEFLGKAFEGADVVIHVASLVDFGQNPKELILKVNVEGVKNVIEACKINNVKALVYTSSLETISRKVPNVEMLDDAPYPKDVSDFLGGY
uniref:3-beta hydroxysteroid dehydrogenase/isomerase domain-containing protein n=1 Tax=Aplanochytrium stocchinoi TaxID=215587 RepID=A0A7S3LNF1_9STRA|mmetsp:Transcript_42/g.76  ORF Transcript_42/g.76 Transcript_42/m.76 type:complete len:166 (+) Transcript_42:88-585(+)